MNNIIQKIRSVLIPEIGLDVEPEFVQESEINNIFSRTIAHIAVRFGDRSIMVKGTSDGRVHVASSGSSMELYSVEDGNAPDAYNAGSTYESAEAIYTTDILVETFDATISFRNAAGVWGDGKSLLVGTASIDFMHYGIRIQNRVALSVAEYEITQYR